MDYQEAKIKVDEYYKANFDVVHFNGSLPSDCLASPLTAIRVAIQAGVFEEGQRMDAKNMEAIKSIFPNIEIDKSPAEYKRIKVVNQRPKLV